MPGTAIGTDAGRESLSAGSNPRPRTHPLTLTELRERAGISLRNLEARTGIHRGRLSELERGIRWPRTRELRALERHYGVPGLRVAWVIVIDEDEKP